VETINRRLVSWASVLDDATREQAVTSSGMPFLFPHLALMPDAHLGKGATLGSVIPTKRAITPTAVGVDTGYGMAAVRTSSPPLVPLREAIERAVPLSAGRYNAKIVATAEPRVAELTALAERGEGVDLTRSRNWALQLGTLGSGNHVIEVTLDELDRVWVFLHSGSQGVGNRTAPYGRAETYSIDAMSWGIVELEPEVREWLEQLSTAQFATAAFYIDLVAEQGPLLSEPYTRQLDGKLRELRFHLDRAAVRVTYWIAPGRRIVLLTVFVKTRMREDREVARARRALARCIEAEHEVEEDETHG